MKSFRLHFFFPEKVIKTEAQKKKKRKRMEEEEDDLLYGDIVTSQGEDGAETLRVTKTRLEKSERSNLARIRELETQLESLEKENARLTKENRILATNMSSLYDTAKMELKRKDEMLREERVKNFKFESSDGGGERNHRKGKGGETTTTTRRSNPPPPKPPPGGPPGKKRNS